MSLSSIERAKLIAELLDLRKGLTDLSALAKAKSISRILGIRKQLFGKGSAFQEVLQRLKDNPLPEYREGVQGLTQAYEEAIRKWLPDSHVYLRNITADNAAGTAKAIYNTLSRYPALAQALEYVGTREDLAKEAKKIEDKIAKRKQKRIDAIQSTLKLSDTAKKDLLQAFDEGIERFRTYWSQFYDPWRSGKQIAKWLLECVGLSGNRKAQNLIRKAYNGMAFDPRDELKQDVIQGLRRLYLESKTEQLAKAAFSESGEDEETSKDKKNSLYIAAQRKSFTGRGKLKNAYAWVSPFRYLGNSSAHSSAGVVISAYSNDIGHELHKTALRDQENLWHPINTISATDPTDGECSVITHELGHSLDYLLNVRHDYRILQLYWDNRTRIKSERKQGIMTKSLSNYANEDVMEMVAEGFMEYRLSKSPRPMAMQIGKIIDEYYEKQFGQGVK